MITFGNKRIENFSDPYIIAEIGANHNGDMELAKKMIAEAKACGADAAKFQSWTPESLVASEEYQRNQKYDDSPKKHFGSLKDMITKYYLRKEQHFELKEYCDKIGIEFCSTPFSIEEADLLEEMNVPFFKIASMDINNVILLEHIACKKRPMVLSTGMATLSEIENAVKVIKATGNDQIVLLHCIAVYPPAMKDIRLNNIPMLREVFNCPVGFSDHSIGTAIPLASVALGACIIEKHFTTNKDLEGWDHEISADPDELKVIVRDSRNIISALGSRERIVSDAEEAKKLKFRRSIVVARDLDKGHVLMKEDLHFKRPGTGIQPDEVKYVIGRTLNKKISADELIHWDSLQ